VKRALIFIFLALIAVPSFGFQQQGRRTVSLDNDDLSPLVPPPGLKLLEINPGEYSPEGSGYSVRLPAAPASLVRKMLTIAGDLTVYYLTLKTDDMEYTIGYVDYPFTVDVSDPERIYGGFRDGVLSRTGATLQTDKPVQLKDKIGREIVMTAEGQKETSRIFLVNHRMYAANVENHEKQDRSKEINQFFSSIKITQSNQ